MSSTERTTLGLRKNVFSSASRAEGGTVGSKPIAFMAFTMDGGIVFRRASAYIAALSTSFLLKMPFLLAMSEAHLYLRQIAMFAFVE